MIAPPPAVNFVKKEPRQVGLKDFVQLLLSDLSLSCIQTLSIKTKLMD